MTRNSLTRVLPGVALWFGTAGAFAHDGHGMQGSHWHATDVSGFVLVVVLATLAIWLSRGK
ncbi:MAG: hypothetical protein ABIR26_09435 [Ramlibacter sp.]